MTKKEEKEYKKNLIISQIEDMIYGKVDKLDSKNKKLLKDFLSKDLSVCLYTVDYSRPEYYNWEVEQRQRVINSNFERLIYLLNSNYEICEIMLNRDSVEIKDNGYKKSQCKDIVDYNVLAEEVGL